MKRKRNNLDVAEANYLYARVLVEFNKFDKFKNLSVPERNNMIDKTCLKCIEAANKNDDDKEVLMQEIESYKLSEEDKKKFYDNSVFDNSMKKPDNFNDEMKKKYHTLITKTVEEFMKMKEG